MPMISMVSDNIYDISLSKVGDNLTITFESSEIVQQPSVTIGGVEADSVSGDGTNWTAVRVMTDSDIEGIVLFTIDYLDLAGNAGVQNVSTTDETGVIFDRTIPDMTVISIVSDNNNYSHLAKVDDELTLTFTSTESIQTPVVMLGELEAEIGGDSVSWIATKAMTVYDVEGNVSILIEYMDMAGNQGISDSITTDASSVIFDMTSPQLTVNIVSDNQTNYLSKPEDEVTLSFVSDEMLYTPPTVTIDGNEEVVGPQIQATDYSAVRTMQVEDTQGEISFVIGSIMDLAGNITNDLSMTTDTSSVIFDSVLPTITDLSISSNNNFDNDNTTSLARANDSITITFFTSEDCQIPSSTISNSSANVNDSGNQSSWTAVRTMLNTDVDGVIEFTIDYHDLAGNAGVQATSILSGTNVTFDNTAPLISDVDITSTNEFSDGLAKPGDIVTVTLTSNEDIYSLTSVNVVGQEVLESNVNKVSSTTWRFDYVMTDTDNEGYVDFEFTANDLSGNPTLVIDQNTGSVLFDRTPPTLSSVSIFLIMITIDLAKVDDTVNPFNNSE